MNHMSKSLKQLETDVKNAQKDKTAESNDQFASVMTISLLLLSECILQLLLLGCFYALVNIVAGGIMFPECSYLRESVHACPEQTFLLARYLVCLLTELDQTFTSNRLWGKDECVKFWGQMVYGQGHSGVKYAPKLHFLAF